MRRYPVSAPSQNEIDFVDRGPLGSRPGVLRRGSKGTGGANALRTMGMSMATARGKSLASKSTAVGQAVHGGASTPPACGLEAVHLTVHFQ